MPRRSAALAALLLALALCCAGGAAARPGSSGGATPAAGAWPLTPPVRVGRAFDPPAERWDAGHRGVDLVGRPGMVVRSSLGGVVRHAAPIAGRGVVVVGHGATRTTYEPVAASVSRGDRVAAGQALGRLELAASHCLPGACLHWGWRRGEEYLDPLTLVTAARVRLLPVG